MQVFFIFTKILLQILIVYDKMTIVKIKYSVCTPSWSSEEVRRPMTSGIRSSDAFDGLSLMDLVLRSFNGAVSQKKEKRTLNLTI